MKTRGTSQQPSLVMTAKKAAAPQGRRRVGVDRFIAWFVNRL
jgi:hypothetical protein